MTDSVSTLLNELHKFIVDGSTYFAAYQFQKFYDLDKRSGKEKDPQAAHTLRNQAKAHRRLACRAASRANSYKQQLN